MSTGALRACDLQDSAEFAASCDAADELKSFRDRFHIPTFASGKDVVYLCGNSLGLQPKTVRQDLLEELDDWAKFAVEGHTQGRRQWVRYHEHFAAGSAELVGARHDEVVLMNTLTVNLHLMMVSFYRPAGARTKILIESGAFPSDRYAVESHIRSRGLDPAMHLVVATPRSGERCLRMDDLAAIIQREGPSLALVLLPGVQYLTGQVLDMARITAAARQAGAACGWDLAHAVGNVPLALHDWDCDFACWCSYKYLNGGPGAVAGAFVHQRHGRNHALPRYHGWWSNDAQTRFQMREEFAPTDGAEGWQISNPPILSLTPLLSSLAIFLQAGQAALHAKSRRLSGYLYWLLAQRAIPGVQVVTPAETHERGAQISISLARDAEKVWRTLVDGGFVVDFRTPDILRAAPTPLYNNMTDVRRFVDALGSACRG